MKRSVPGVMTVWEIPSVARHLTRARIGMLKDIQVAVNFSFISFLLFRLLLVALLVFRGEMDVVFFVSLAVRLHEISLQELRGSDMSQSRRGRDA